MELEHRFDLPVGVEQAWTTLTDVGIVAECFPGAHLEKVEGDTFTGSLKFKAGPLRLTYKGTARFVEKNAAAHTATLEATGTEGPGSTGTVMVTAVAKPLSPNMTQVDVVTTLSLTGRPAQFGRPLMVEIGNRHIGQFADAVSTKLVGRGTGGAELVDVENPDTIAAAREQALHRGDDSGQYVRRVTGDRSAAHRSGDGRLSSLLTTALPAALVFVGVILLRKLLRTNPASGAPADS